MITINKTLKYPAYLSNWEYQFLTSIKEQIKKHSKLSKSQIVKLFDLYHNVNKHNIHHKAIIYGQKVDL